jgi:plastocyanin
LSRTSRVLRRFAVAALAVALVGVALSACGSSEADEDGAQKLTFTIAKKGQKTEIKGPKEAETGLAEITLVNNGQGATDLQLVRVEGEHSAAEAGQALGQVIEGNAFPEWFFAAGGVGTILPGKRQTVIQVLKPGTYYAFYTEGQTGPLNRPSPAVVEINGEESDDEVEGKPTVRAFEYGFEADTLTAGGVEVDFDNSGDQPHHIVASKFVGNGTLEEAEKYLKTEKGKNPLTEQGFQATSVLEGDEAQLVTLDLEPGRYAFYCFVADRKGGQPHLFKGMIDEVEVEAAPKGE